MESPHTKVYKSTNMFRKEMIKKYPTYLMKREGYLDQKEVDCKHMKSEASNYWTTTKWENTQQAAALINEYIVATNLCKRLKISDFKRQTRNTLKKTIRVY